MWENDRDVYRKETMRRKRKRMMGRKTTKKTGSHKQLREQLGRKGCEISVQKKGEGWGRWEEVKERLGRDAWSFRGRGRRPKKVNSWGEKKGDER